MIVPHRAFTVPGEEILSVLPFVAGAFLLFLVLRVLMEMRERLEESERRNREQEEEIARSHRELEETARLLARRTEEVERAYQYRTEFLSNVSHEIRTPLNSLLLLTKLLAQNREGNLNERQLHCLKTIGQSGSDLVRIIHEVLDLAKIESGQVEIVEEPFEVCLLERSLAPELGPVAERKGLFLAFAVDPDVPATVITDGTRLTQVLRNLLSNAIKFTEKGAVTVRLRAAGESWLSLEVEDTGVGIEPAKIDEIFEPFRQADASASRRYSGTGLGLTICQQLARLMGGRIEVTSAPGRGSTFRFVFPRRATAEPAKPGGPPSDDRYHIKQKNRVILVVEDDPRNAEILLERAHERGFQAILASTGEEALVLARDCAPAGIVLDIGLPGIKGDEVLRRLQLNPRTRSIPVHVLSGTGRDQSGLPATVSHFQKPLRAGDWGRIVESIENASNAQRPRLLLVEDEAALAEMVEETLLLRRPDVLVERCATGRAALAAMDAGRFDAIILDLGLPDIAGVDLLELMVMKPDCPHITIFTGRQLSTEDMARIERHTTSIVSKADRAMTRLVPEVDRFLQDMTLQRSSGTDLPWTPSHVLPGRTFLIVDDDERNIFALTSLLEQTEARVISATSGAKALELLERGTRVDAVLMDVMMPEMDGLETTRRIRSQRWGDKLPVIAVTAKAMPGDREACLEAGANDYLTKPIELDRLCELLFTWIGEITPPAAAAHGSEGGPDR